MTYQFLRALAIVVGLVGTWLAARARFGWLLCIASTAALVVPKSWPPGGPIALASDTEEGLPLAPGYPEDSIDAQESHSLGGEPQRKRSWWIFTG